MKIDNSDLNMVDYLNGQGTIDYKEFVPQDLTGVFAKYNANFGTNKANLIFQNALLFINQKKNELISNIMENWEYENLPDDFDKYDLENKLLTNGQVFIIKMMDSYFCVNASFNEVDIYNNPINEIIINEPNTFIHNYKVKDFVMMRNNLYSENVLVKSMRMLNILEKILYELEANVTASKPKGIIVNNGIKINTPDNKPTEDALNSIVNSQATFYEITLTSEDAGNIFAEGKQLFTPIELRDRTQELIQSYLFFNTQLKEMFGNGVNNLEGKRERLITDEIAKQQKVSDLNLKHLFNIRKNDLKKVNKKFGLNIRIRLSDDNSDEIVEKEEL